MHYALEPDRVAFYVGDWNLGGAAQLAEVVGYDADEIAVVEENRQHGNAYLPQFRVRRMAGTDDFGVLGLDARSGFVYGLVEYGALVFEIVVERSAGYLAGVGYHAEVYGRIAFLSEEPQALLHDFLFAFLMVYFASHGIY